MVKLHLTLVLRVNVLGIRIEGHIVVLPLLVPFRYHTEVLIEVWQILDTFVFKLSYKFVITILNFKIRVVTLCFHRQVS